MKITITGLEEALSQLKKVQNVREPVNEAIYELLKDAEKIVLQAYALQGGENTDFHSEIEMQPNGGTLRITGSDVGFLEFGAGTTVASSDVFASEVDYEVYSGSWSVEHSKQFVTRGYWYVRHNVRYHYLFPTRGAEKALNYILNNWQQAVEKKVSEWIG